MQNNEQLQGAVQEIVEKYERNANQLLPILTEAQELIEFNYVPEGLAQIVANQLNLPISQVYEVVTFFSTLSETPRGRNVIQVCDSTVCRLNKNDRLAGTLEKFMGIKMGETTEDQEFTLEFTPCFGACDISPAIRVNRKVYGNLTEEKIHDILEQIGGIRT